MLVEIFNNRVEWWKARGGVREKERYTLRQRDDRQTY